MPVKKVAISLLEPVLEAVDELAARRGESRSHLITTILSRVARAKRDRDITKQINVLFADEEIAAEQKRTADELLRSSPWHDQTW
jgi:metal-responsive CopG/Arc/MetJ family transcriptional regulator